MKTIAVLLGVMWSAVAQAAVPIQYSANWARPAFAGKNTAAYLKIKNTSDKTLYLTGASCCANSVAKTVELHVHKIDHMGVARMRQTDEIKIPPHAEVTLKPGGTHIMLMGLQTDLKEGQDLELNLEFKEDPWQRKGEIQKISFPIQKTGRKKA